MESSTPRSRNAFLTALGLLVAIAVVGIASRGSTPSGEGGARGPTDALADIFFSLYIVSVVAGGVLFLYMLALRRTALAQAGVNSRRRTWQSGIGMLVLVAGALLLARNMASKERGAGVALPPAIGGGSEASATTSGADTYEAEFAWIPVLGTLGLIAVAIFGAWWSGRVRRRARGELRGSLLAAGLAAAVNESLDDLRAERDPRRAVIAAYARLEQVLGAHGLPRHASEAPLEYLRRMLGELSVSPPAARRLTDLFERARFSQHAVGAQMKEEAIAALETVRDDLAAARAVAEQERTAGLEAFRQRATGDA